MATHGQRSHTNAPMAAAAAADVEACTQVYLDAAVAACSGCLQLLEALLQHSVRWRMFIFAAFNFLIYISIIVKQARTHLSIYITV